MSYPRPRERASAFPDSLDRHVATFCKALAIAGYAATARQRKRSLVARFIVWIRHRRIAPARLDERALGTYLKRGARRPCEHERAALRQFLEHLRGAGVAPRRRIRAPSATDVLVERYLGHLRSTRGLSDRSIDVYAPSARTFVAALRLPEQIAALGASAVRTYLLDRSRDRSIAFVKRLAASLRSFLRFLFLDGAIAIDLSTAVPPVRRWSFATVPPFLAPEEVERVLATTDRSTTRGRRAFAILLLLARLGLRAGEIVALELDDVHWDVGEIVIRGKGRVHDRLPLPTDVGAAMASYLCDARGRSTSRRVFLRLHAPRGGLSNPTAVCVVAREALRRADVRRAGRVAAHVFRHSLATRMIRRGASLGEISQVLRHRSIATTQHYAKVEFEALRGVARPWPAAEVRP